MVNEKTISLNIVIGNINVDNDFSACISVTSHLCMLHFFFCLIDLCRLLIYHCLSKAVDYVAAFMHYSFQELIGVSFLFNVYAALLFSVGLRIYEKTMYK